MGPRVQFICQSSACRRQVEIEIPTGGGAGQGLNLLCVCGSKMKKVYTKPVFQELSKAERILRLGDSGLLTIQDKTILIWTSILPVVVKPQSIRLLWESFHEKNIDAL